jgi:hypothetical protein
VIVFIGTLEECTTAESAIQVPDECVVPLFFWQFRKRQYLASFRNCSTEFRNHVAQPEDFSGNIFGKTTPPHRMRQHRPSVRLDFQMSC